MCKQTTAGDKNISIHILHLSCRTGHLQFSLVLQTHAQGVMCNMTSSSNSSQSTRPTGRRTSALWRITCPSYISFIITSGRVEFLSLEQNVSLASKLVSFTLYKLTDSYIYYDNENTHKLKLIWMILCSFK